MKEVIKRIYFFLLSPFTENSFFFAVLAFLVCIAYVVSWIIYGDPVFAIYLGLHGFIMSYAIALIVSAINNAKLKKILKAFILVLAFINFCVDAAIHMACKIGFTNDMVAIVMGTNISESKEFLGTYISLGYVVVVAIVCVLLYILCKIKKYIVLWEHKIAPLLLVLVFLSSVVIFARKSENWDGIFINKVVSFLKYKSPPDLRSYYTHPCVTQTDETIPDNLLIIIGESFKRNHSSLYGYEMCTNPLLNQIKEDSLLFVYDNVVSPTTTTIQTFQDIMSLYNTEDGDEVKWYECTTLMEILSLAGYNTLWLSNQSPTGMYDNIVTKYAELCDSVVWAGSKYKGISKKDYDGKVVEVLDSLRKHNARFVDGHKNVIIIHLMGSHYVFAQRYPQEYDYFQPEQYPEYENNKAEVISDYDNSVLYNDFVVSEILNRFADKSTLAFYFPDHGIDLYESSNDYFGHAIVSNPESINVSRQIPFVVYCSSVFQSQRPDIKETLDSIVGDSYNTGNLIQLVTDVMGIDVIQ